MPKKKPVPTPTRAPAKKPPARPAPPPLAPPKPQAAPPKSPASRPNIAPPLPPRPPKPPARPEDSAPLKPLASPGPGKPSTVGPKSGVVVVGSLNMDLVVRTEIMPTPGQTVMGQDLLETPGGKGANQATAAGKLWHRRLPAGALSAHGSKIIGRIGDDLFGQHILTALQAAKVDTASVQQTKKTPTGTAVILVDRHGENAIVVAGGANRHLAATDLLAKRQTIETSVVLLAQLEIPADTVACAFALAKRSNVLTILDPAPAPPEGLPESLYHVDILIPNQAEAHQLTGIQVRTADDARRAAERFLLRGTRIVIIKMGSQGAVIVHKDPPSAATHPSASPAPNSATHAQLVPGFRVPVVDTTAAGDAFAGALAVALAESMPLAQAVRFANAAGALACTKAGAIAAMPTRAEVDTLLAGT